MKTYAGYSITDKDGKVISEEPGNTLLTGPTNQTIIFFVLDIVPPFR